jgi:PadR family transcriptional regulator, regulatory protein PadR
MSPRPDLLGEFELVVLLALMRLGPEGYGMQVRREIEERAGRDAAIGAVYATLDRLEEKGMVRSKVGAPTPQRGGRARRIFAVTARGTRAVRETRAAFARMADGLFPEGEPA